jgi:hypothetical protein
MIRQNLRTNASKMRSFVSWLHVSFLATSHLACCVFSLVPKETADIYLLSVLVGKHQGLYTVPSTGLVRYSLPLRVVDVILYVSARFSDV